MGKSRKKWEGKFIFEVVISFDHTREILILPRTNFGKEVFGFGGREIVACLFEGSGASRPEALRFAIQRLSLKRNLVVEIYTLNHLFKS